VRVGRVVGTALLFGFFHFHFHFHVFHHRFHGPPFDYVGLAVGSAVSSAGLPGPGESLLIAAGIIAASGKLDLASVVTVAFAGATVGGIVGWIAGLKAGRTVLSAPGPFRRLRLHALKRGDRIFERHPVFAIVMTPSWVAGIHGVRSRIYQPLNALSAALWAAGVGVSAYLVGPSVVDWVDDFGLLSAGIVVALVIGTVALTIRRHRRVEARRATRPVSAAESSDAPESTASPERTDAPDSDDAAERRSSRV
jgi:membrane protein DedA with SNARE-associated domain